ncbi:MAG TPA: hypothetical protein VIM11_24400, partial [Tepidisphaeraceae bacterium]
NDPLPNPPPAYRWREIKGSRRKCHAPALLISSILSSWSEAKDLIFERFTGYQILRFAPG